MLKTRTEQKTVCHPERSEVDGPVFRGDYATIKCSLSLIARTPLNSIRRSLLLALAFFLFVQNGLPQSSAARSTSTLILHVSNIHNSKGVIRFAVFASPEGWPEDKTKAERYGSLPANVGTVTFRIADLPNGVYAISVIHDENENHKLDRDFFGRPKEGIGFGNNPKIGFSAPGWKQSSLQVSNPSTETTVNLRYP